MKHFISCPDNILLHSALRAPAYLVCMQDYISNHLNWCNIVELQAITDTIMSSASSLGSASILRYSSPLLQRKRFDDRSQTAISIQLESNSSAAQSLEHLHLQSSQVNQDIFTNLVKWNSAKSIEATINSEDFVHSFGKPLSLELSSLHIAVGTDKGSVIGFNYRQEMVFALSLYSADFTLASTPEISPVSCISFSSDSTFLAAGFSDGTIASWDLDSVKATPGHYSIITAYGIIHPIILEARFIRNSQGHLKDVPVNTVLFVGGSNHQMISSDTSGLVFYHYGFTKFMRKYHTTQKLLGKNDTNQTESTGKFHIQACQVLPIGTVPQITDRIGLVAVMTTNILAIVSVCSLNNANAIYPITHLKLSRSKHVHASPNTLPSGCLSWYPCIKYRGEICNAKLAYAWNNVLSVLELDNKGIPENLPAILSELKDKDKGITGLHIIRKARWKTLDRKMVILELKWLNSEILTALVKHSDSTETKLVFLYYSNSQNSSQLTEVGVDDLDSQQIAWTKLTKKTEPNHEYIYQGSIQIFRHTLMILVNSHSTSGKNLLIGKTFKWADKLMDCLQSKDFYGALVNACEFYSSENHGRLVLSGLPHTKRERHEVVRPFLIQIMEESVLPLFQSESNDYNLHHVLLLYLQITAMLSIESNGVVPERTLKILESIEEIYQIKHEYYKLLEDFILSLRIRNVSPTIFKNLVEYYMESGKGERLTEIVCVLDTSTLSIDMTLKLCSKYELRECGVYIWNKLLHDYKTPFIALIQDLESAKYDNEQKLLVYAYMSYMLSGRQFPSDELLSEADEKLARVEICKILFGMDTPVLPLGKILIETDNDTLFPQLFYLLKFNTFEMLLTLNEFFENPCLNTEGSVGLSRQYIMDALFDVFDMNGDSFLGDDFVRFAIFLARNYPKYFQFIRISESKLQRAIELLCGNSNDDIHEDCELALESLLPFYDMPIDTLLIEKLHAAKFYNVLFGLYRSQGNLNKALEIWLEKQNSIELTLSDYERNFTVISSIIRSTFQSSQGKSGERKQLEDFINLNFEELAARNMEDMVVLANLYNTEFHLGAICCTNNYLAYQYLSALFNKYDAPMSGRIKAQLVVKYIELSALFDIDHLSVVLTRFLPVLETKTNLKYDLEEFLKQGNYSDALAILLNLEGHSQRALDEVLNAMEQGVILPDGQFAVQKYLDVAIMVSEQANDEGIWKYFVQKLISFTNLTSGSTLEMLNQGIYMCFRKMIESNSGGSSHIAFARVFNDILEIATLANVRSILQEVLVSFFFDNETQKITLNEISREIFKHMANIKMDNIRGWQVKNMHCTSCDKAMCGSGVPAESYQAWEDKIRERTFYTPTSSMELYKHLGLIVFKCGHGYHLQCLEGLGGTTVCVMCTFS